LSVNDTQHLRSAKEESLDAKLENLEEALSTLEASGKVYESLYQEEVQLKVLLEDAAHLSLKAMTGWMDFAEFFVNMIDRDRSSSRCMMQDGTSVDAFLKNARLWPRIIERQRCREK